MASAFEIEKHLLLTFLDLKYFYITFIFYQHDRYITSPIDFTCSCSFSCLQIWSYDCTSCIIYYAHFKSSQHNLIKLPLMIFKKIINLSRNNPAWAMYFINLISNKNKGISILHVVLNNSLIHVIYIYSAIYFSFKRQKLQYNTLF